MREGVYIYLLQSQGIGSTEALALSLIVFGLQVFLATIGGLLQLQSHLVKKELKVQS